MVFSERLHRRLPLNRLFGDISSYIPHDCFQLICSLSSRYFTIESALDMVAEVIAEVIAHAHNVR